MREMTTAIPSLVLAAVCTATASAHGPQIQVGIQSGQIVTRALLPDEPYNGSMTPNQRVYEIPMAQRNLSDANDGWYAQPNSSFAFTGPGIATALGGFGTGSILSLTFTEGLTIWNGSGFVDPGTEQMDVYRGSAHVAGAITSDAGPLQSFSFTALTNTGDEHKTAFIRLLGDGVSPNTPSDDGIYLLGLQLTSDQAGVEPSDPYYFLLNKNGSAADASAALAYVNTHIVPEPEALGYMAIVLCGLLFVRLHVS